MNYKVAAATILFWVLFSAFQCNEKDCCVVPQKVFKAVLKYDGGCTAQYGCVIIGGEIDTALVDNNWNYKGQNFQKAFSVKNGCHFPKIQIDEVFSFKIISSDIDNTCNVCTVALGGFPAKALAIKVLN